MSDVANLIKLVSLVNDLATVAVQFGLSMQDLAMRQQKAAMEGREFGIEDLEELKAEAKKALDELSAKLS